MESQWYRIFHIERVNKFGVFCLLLQLSEAERGVREERKQTERHKPSQKKKLKQSVCIIISCVLASLLCNI